MIIYPSDSFVTENQLLERKLNADFELARYKQNTNKKHVFADDGVPVFVSEESSTEPDAESYHYIVLPLIDFLCFEIFSLNNDANSNSISLKAIIEQWKSYVQTVRSHTSLYPTKCKWQKYNLDMSDAQLTLYKDLESLLLKDELLELDDIVRVSCGLQVNVEGSKISEFQLASRLAQSFSQLLNAKKMLKQGESCAIEKAALEVKCEKLNEDVITIENIAAENKAQLQRKTQEVTALAEELEYLKSKTNVDCESKDKQINALKAELLKVEHQLQLQQKEAEHLRENNLSQAQELENVLNEKQQNEEQFKYQLQTAELKLANTLEKKDNYVTELKKESELAQLQIMQLQEELEALFNAKSEVESDFENHKQAQELQLAKVQSEKDNHKAELKQESELAQLQIMQLQEELEVLFNAKSEVESDFENHKQAQELQLAKVQNEKDNPIAELKQESELAQLQILQLQEELETLFAEKQEHEVQHQTELQLLRDELSQGAVEKNNASNLASNIASNIQAENELMQLQILQLQEELGFYFEKSNALLKDDFPQPDTIPENGNIDVAKQVLEKHNTLCLINRLITQQGREK